MNIRRFLLSCIMLFIGISRHLAAAEASAAGNKPGYNVVVDVSYNEAGVAEEVKLVDSDDASGEMILNKIALNLAANLKQAPRLKDGKPVKFTVRAPFNFPVEGDEGAAANNAPKPSIHSAQQPAFPEALVAKGENGGAILELIIGTYGNVESVKVLRASHPEYAEAAAAAVKNWIFAPAKNNGMPVESRWRIAIAFSANGKDVEWLWKIAPRPSLGGYTVVHAKLPSAAPAVTEPAAPAAPSAGSPVFTLPVAPETAAPVK